MKKVYLQYWEESERGWGIRPDGCSLHMNPQNHKEFVSKIYEGRDPNNVPDEYERICGPLIQVEVKDSLYDKLEKNKGNLRLMQTSLSNLITFEEIKTKLD